ncbi:MAG TPA: NADPH-dependent FMN reductase [Bacteroidia bacterium]|nr:NADPH-dependent FMN reductase [Bacteroidia bacterium]
MSLKKNVFVIIGSAGSNSANEVLINNFANLTKDCFNLSIFNKLKSLPPFDPELSIHHPPKAIIAFRNHIEKADGVIICTPEYIFSIPSGLKNALEWCVSTTIFTGKPVGLITASAHGQKGHDELQLIMQTLMAQFDPETTLLIQGIKGKLDEKGSITDEHVKTALKYFSEAFKLQLSRSEK